ncbi:MAG: DNA primase [Lachnospiraceae bacterium]|nr:DNA primase [Lachnospiraceae bacterium]
MAFYSEDIIQEVCDRNDIVDVIGQYVKLTRKGSSLFGLCPFHNEKTGSFSVSPSKQMYYCFGCGAGGNVLTFVREYENYSFTEAIEYLADRAGIDLPKVEMTEEEKRASDLKSRIYEINKETATFYYYQLLNSNDKKGYEYFKNKRGLTDETIKNWGLGYAGMSRNNLYAYLKNKGFKDEELNEAGLFHYSEKEGFKDKFWNRVMFPILDVNRHVIAFGGRVMGEGEPKYLNSPETRAFSKKNNLFGLYIARSTRKKFFILCEGYIDVISLHQAGFTNAVASLGTAFGQSQAYLIKKYVDEVYLAYDSDEAGIKAKLRALSILKEAGISARVIDSSPCKDPDEFVRSPEYGPVEYEKRIKEAKNGFLFSIEVLERDYDLKDPDGKTRFFKEVAGRLLSFEDELERNNYTDAVAGMYSITSESLKKMINELALKGVNTRDERPVFKSGFNQNKKDGMIEAQKLLITWLIEEEGLYEQLKEYISPEDFTSDLYKNVASQVFEQFESEGRVNPASIMNRFMDEDEQREIAGLFNARLKAVESEESKVKAIRDVLYKVKKNSFDTREDSSTDPKELMLLIEEKKKLEGYKNIPVRLR